MWSVLTLWQVFANAELLRWEGGSDEHLFAHSIRLDWAMREWAFAEDWLKPQPWVVGFWPEKSLNEQLLADVHMAIVSFSANMQGVLSEDFNSFHSLSFPWQKLPRAFPLLKRYMGGHPGTEAPARHFHRLQQKYSRSIRRVMDRLENVTDGSRLMREASLKLLEAGKEAWSSKDTFLEARG